MADSIVLEHILRPASLTSTTANPLRRQRVYIFPTRHGLIFGIMLMIMLVGAINYNNSLAYVLTFMLASLGLVVVLYTYQNLAGLSLTCHQPRAVFSGQVAEFPILIDNRNYTARYALHLQRYPSSRKALNNKLPVPAPQVVDIQADELTNVSLHLKTNRRGLVIYGRLRLSTTFPLGLLRAWSYFDVRTPCVVYPQPRGNQPLPVASRADQLDQLGQHEDGVDDFVGFRKYRHGDPVYKIAWKAFARQDELLLKHFKGHGSQRIQLCWEDTNPVLDLESRLSQLCQWIINLDTRGYLYGMQLPGCDIGINTGDSHRSRCLKALAEFSQPV